MHDLVVVHASARAVMKALESRSAAPREADVSHRFAEPNDAARPERPAYRLFVSPGPSNLTAIRSPTSKSPSRSRVWSRNASSLRPRLSARCARAASCARVTSDAGWPAGTCANAECAMTAAPNWSANATCREQAESIVCKKEEACRKHEWTARTPPTGTHCVSSDSRSHGSQPRTHDRNLCYVLRPR